MAQCLITSGLTRTCDYSTGGLAEVYFANKSEVESIAQSADNTVTGITLVTGATFHRYYSVPQTSQALEDIQVGTISRNILQTINAQFDNITQAKRNILNTLVLGELVAIVKKQGDEKYWLYEGGARGLTIVTGTNDSGTADSDDVGFTLSLAASNNGYANEVDSSIIAGLL